MTRARTSLLLTGIAFTALAAVSAVPPAHAAIFQVSCTVDRDEGQGELRIRNTGDLTIPATSTISWHASTGKKGFFKLFDELAPGQRTFEFNGDTVSLKMGIDTCTAAVTDYPPQPIGPAHVDQSIDAFTEPRIKVLDQSALDKCKYCDVAPHVALQTQGMEGGAAMAQVTGDVDVYDVPDGVGTVIGMLRQGTQVPLILCRQDQWCQVQLPQGAAWVWGEFLDH